MSPRSTRQRLTEIKDRRWLPCRVLVFRDRTGPDRSDFHFEASPISDSNRWFADLEHRGLDAWCVVPGDGELVNVADREPMSSHE
jgi:hypothetical protein